MTLRDPAVQPLDPNTIFVGAPGDPLANQHIPAHQQIKDEIVLNDARLRYLEGLLTKPPPLAPGAPFQSYTDPFQTVWVAQGGVAAGIWRRATDVLYARVFRNAAYTFPAVNPVNVPFNAISQDEYGLWNQAGANFITPLPGMWAIDAPLCVAFTAVGQYIQSTCPAPAPTITPRLWPTAMCSPTT